MASRKSKKNNTIFLVVLLLLLLLIGWLLWKIFGGASAPRATTSTQTNTTYVPVGTPSTYYSNTPPIPAVTFSMPVDQPRQTVTPPSPVAPVVEQTPPRITRPQPTTPPPATNTQSTRSTTKRSSASGNSTRPITTVKTPTVATNTAPTPVLRTPTRPTRPAGTSITSMGGSPIEGMAIIRGKAYDPNTGKYYLYCASDRTTLNYTYEVDAATYSEANLGLMYNPAKVATWKFVSSQ